MQNSVYICESGNVQVKSAGPAGENLLCLDRGYSDIEVGLGPLTHLRVAAKHQTKPHHTPNQTASDMRLEADGTTREVGAKKVIDGLRDDHTHARLDR